MNIKYYDKNNKWLQKFLIKNINSLVNVEDTGIIADFYLI